MKEGDKVKIKKGLEWRFYYANGLTGKIVHAAYSPNEPYLVEWPKKKLHSQLKNAKTTHVSYKKEDLELAESIVIDSYSIC